MATEISTMKDSSIPQGNLHERLIGLALIASAVSAAIGIVFLILFFSGAGNHFGPLNDISVVIQYVLLIPIMHFVHRLIPEEEGVKTRATKWMGMIGVFAVIILQSLLVIGLIPFQRQIFLVIPAFLIVTAWFAIMEGAGKDEPRLPKGRRLAILAGLVFGYPVWALTFYHQLKNPQGNDPSVQERD